MRGAATVTERVPGTLLGILQNFFHLILTTNVSPFQRDVSGYFLALTKKKYEGCVVIAARTQVVATSPGASLGELVHPLRLVPLRTAPG